MANDRISISVGSQSAPIVTPSRPAFLNCLQSITADIRSCLTPAPIHTKENREFYLKLVVITRDKLAVFNLNAARRAGAHGAENIVIAQDVADPAIT